MAKPLNAPGAALNRVMARPEPVPRAVPVPFTVVRSRRKTMALVLHPDNQLEVRCGLKMPLAEIERFIRDKESWIRRKMTENGRLVQVEIPGDTAQLAALRELTRAKVKMVLERFPQLLPSQVTIRRQKRRWGSCSKAGLISINVCAGLLPDDLLEYIVVHELCHLVQFDHSPRFHQLLEQVLPGARSRRQALQRYWLT